MPNPRLLSLLNLGSNGDTAPEVKTQHHPSNETQPVEGQLAIQVQPCDVAGNEQPNDVEARKEGWLVLLSNEMYNAQAWKNTEVFIMRTENNTWEAWRETWKEGAPKSISTKQIAKGVPFPVALKQATNYIKVLTRKK